MMMDSKRRGWAILGVLGGMLALWFGLAAGWGVQPAWAQPLPGEEAPTPQADAGSPDTDCLMCHTNHNFRGRFANGQVISLYVDVGEFENSVHGPEGLECIACHPNTRAYPHRPDQAQVDCTTCHLSEDGRVGAVVRDLDLVVDLPYADVREMVLRINQECQSCHEEAAKEAQDSMHVRAQESGNRDAPVCADCHGSHDIQPPGQPRARVPQLCGQCHRPVFTTYQASVHGQALQQNPNHADVPTCVSCHGVHSVRGPRTPGFHNDMIAVCGQCHGDAERMARYDLSAQVYVSYLREFHGRAVNVARLAGPGPESAEATCYDCHGVHNIQPVDDPRATVHGERLLTTCQQCHPAAGPRFTTAWNRHQEPSWERTPVLAAIDWLYGYVLIPGVIGSFLLYIGLDARKRWQEKRRAVHRALLEAERELARELGADDDGAFDDEDLLAE